MSFQHACVVTDVNAGEAYGTTLNTADGQAVPVGIVRDEDGGWHAIGDMCTHGDVLLSEGDVEGMCIECWGHGAQFNLQTGKPTLPAVTPVPVYPLTISGEDVLVDVDTHM